MELFSLGAKDEKLVWEFLCLAAYETDLEVVRGNPSLAHYASGWGRAGDFGVGALEGGVVIGVAWGRLFSIDDRGFGWVSEENPEISMAVREDFRGRGVGRVLLERLIEDAGERFSGLSLNVRAENIAAVRLYEGCGFARVEGSERINRTGGVSFNMRLGF